MSEKSFETISPFIFIAGSWEARGCERGTYSGKSQQGDISDCEQCNAGQYCDETALTAPSGFCPPGHFCPTGTKGPRDNPCPPGRFYRFDISAAVDRSVFELKELLLLNR